MVVAGILALALALPTGALFGVGYGTGVRIGYEQIYPLLFPKGARPDADQTASNIKSINNIYNAIGGKEASQMGIAKGLADAMEIVNTNPDFRVLEERELRLFGLTPSNSEQRTRYGLDRTSPLPDSFSDIDQFNLDNPSDVEKLDRYRTYTITQLRNIIISTINAQSKRLATQVLNEKLQANQGTGATTDLSRTVIASGELAPSLTKTKQQAIQFTEWQHKLILIKQDFIATKGRRNNEFSNSPKWKIQHERLFIHQKKIAKIALDYRNPNNGIRNAVLQLRKEIASGRWKR